MRHHASFHHAFSGGQGLETISVETFALLMLLHRNGFLDVDKEPGDLLFGLGSGSLDRGAILVDDEYEASADVGVLVVRDFHVLDFAVMAEVLPQFFLGDLGRDSADEDFADLFFNGDFLDLEVATLEGMMLGVVDGQGGRRLGLEQNESKAFRVAGLVSFDADVRDWAEAAFEMAFERFLVGGVGQLRHENLQLLVAFLDFVCHFS